MEVERPSELVGSAALPALADGARRLTAVAAELVALHPCEQLVEDLLADPTGATRSQRQTIAVAFGVARLFQRATQLLERPHLVGRVSVKELGSSSGSISSSAAGERMSPSWSDSSIEPPQLSELRQRPLERQLFRALEVEALPKTVGQQLVERRCELGKVPAQPVVAEQRIHHVLQLLALLGTHRRHQRLHLRHARGELLDDVVEVPCAGEDRAMGEEFADCPARRPTAAPGGAVEVADHVAIRRKLSGVTPFIASARPAKCASSTWRRSVEQGLESITRIRLQEVVVAQAANTGINEARPREQQQQQRR